MQVCAEQRLQRPMDTLERQRRIGSHLPAPSLNDMEPESQSPPAPQCRSVDQRHSNGKLAISSLFRNPEPVSRFFFSVHLSTEMRGGMSLRPVTAQPSFQQH